MGLQIFNEITARADGVVLDNAQGTTPVDLPLLGFGQYRYDYGYISNADAIDHVVRFFYNADGPGVQWADVSVPAGSGFAGVAPVEVFSTVQGANPVGMVFPHGCYFSVSNVVSATVAGAVTVLLLGGTI